jgi:anthranilate phosphoribosyltransferase
MDAARHALRTIMAGDELTRDESRELMDAVMQGQVDDAVFGAVFATLHRRGETVEELVGMAEAMRSHVVAATAPAGSVDTCGTGGDGADTFNVSTCAAFVVAGAGATVAKHGNRAVSSRCGSADVLEQLGGRLESTPEQVAETLDRARFAFLFAPAFHPSMRHAVGPRRAMGVRTAFNFLGPITNPAGVRRQVVGVSDPQMALVVARALAQLGVDRALVVHGSDGLDELTITGPSTVHDVTDGQVRTFEVAPEQLDLDRAPIEAIRGGDVACNTQLLRDVISGELRGAPRDVVVLNAAAALLVAEIADDLADGARRAEHAIDEGGALEQLEAWIATGAPVGA